MTREDIIRMAREVGGSVMKPYDYGAKPNRMILSYDELVSLAFKIAAAEREACAEICYALGNDSLNDEMDYRAFLAFREAEEKIRKRGEVKP